MLCNKSVYEILIDSWNTLISIPKIKKVKYCSFIKLYYLLSRSNKLRII